MSSPILANAISLIVLTLTTWHLLENTRWRQEAQLGIDYGLDRRVLLATLLEAKKCAGVPAIKHDLNWYRTRITVNQRKEKRHWDYATENGWIEWAGGDEWTGYHIWSEVELTTKGQRVLQALSDEIDIDQEPVCVEAQRLSADVAPNTCISWRSYFHCRLES